MRPSFAEYRLPPGRHGLPPELVTANQRWRLLGGCAEVLWQRGYAGTGVAEVTKAAGVSKATFYRNFDSLPVCILATYGLAIESVLAVIEEACQVDPPVTLDEALVAVLEFLEAEAPLAHVLTEAALDDVPGVSAARTGFTARCATLLVSARKEEGDGGAERRALHLLRGVQGWLSMRLAAGEVVKRPEDLARLLAL